MIDHSSTDTRKALYHTLGCKLNFAETGAVAQLMAERGFMSAKPGDIPDVIIINTCSVTELADKKCRQLIRSLHRRYPVAPILVTGCYAQLKGEEIADIEGVAVVAGSNQKLKMTQYLDQWLKTQLPITDVQPTRELTEFQPSCSRGDRTRYFLKVQDGCDYWCTYCTIPKARGRSRSGTIDQLVAQAELAAAEGGKEIVITGVNIGDFGKGRSDNLLDLILALDQVDGIERYRISSVEPNLLTDEIIDFCASSRAFMPHFHIPLQSGSDEILKLMHRHYDTSLFRDKIHRIRETIPDAFIGVDLIVGARGETPERFEQSKRFIEALPITRLHVFPYSERPGTRALGIDYVVPVGERRDRDREMIAISEAKHQAFAERFVGTVRPVLLEHANSRRRGMAGFTDNYLRVNVEASTALDNKIVLVQLDSLDPATLEFQGSIVSEE